MVGWLYSWMVGCINNGWLDGWWDGGMVGWLEDPLPQQREREVFCISCILLIFFAVDEEFIVLLNPFC